MRSQPLSSVKGARAFLLSRPEHWSPQSSSNCFTLETSQNKFPKLLKRQNSKYQNQYWSILVNISKNVRRLRKPKLDSYAFSIFKSWDRSSRKVSQICIVCKLCKFSIREVGIIFLFCFLSHYFGDFTSD